jgi:Protein of unknown function (DUF2587)
MSASRGDREGTADDALSDAEQHGLQAQLARRLEELFHGIQTTLFAQEMAAQQQLQSIADVWAATDRYRAAGHVEDPRPIPGGSSEELVAPDGDPAS